MKATPVFHRREVLPGGLTVEIVIWNLSAPTEERPHGLKYRLQAHRDGHTVVRYGNETGKGDHKHYGRLEERYAFTSMERLLGTASTQVRATMTYQARSGVRA